jgi:uncharacterized protein YdhG (YjbR/CyaY superfamily)
MSTIDLINAIDNVVGQTMEENSDVLAREVNEKYDPNLCTYKNSINILVGKQGLGKSYTVYKEVIKISHVDPSVHVFIVINKDGEPNDTTYEVLKHLFRIPVIFISYDDAEEFVSNMLKYKILYNTIKQKHLESKIVDTQIKELYQFLYISDLSQPYLNTIIYFEDCANNKLFAKPKLYFPGLIATCRHNNLTFFFATQFWKGLTTELKSNLTLVYIFRDYSKQQIQVILNQTPLKHDINTVYQRYRRLINHEKMVIDTYTGAGFVIGEAS